MGSMRWMFASALLLALGCGSDDDGGLCPAPAQVHGQNLGSQNYVRVQGTTSGEGTYDECRWGRDAPEVFYTWSPPVSGEWTFDTEGSAYDTVISVNNGDLTTFPLGCNDNPAEGDDFASLTLNLEACQTVTIVVEGARGDSGDFTLTISGPEAVCDDGLDDDGDGQIDCDDDDCIQFCAANQDWPRSWEQLEEDMLTEVNRRRAMGATCGDDPPSPPVGPLEINDIIRVAARKHSTDMGEQAYFEHDSLDGRTFSDRMSMEGFMGAFPWGENIAAGQSTAFDAVEGFMNSPGHCRNIMNGDYRTVGFGYAFVEGSPYGHYWTQDFAAGH